MSDEVKVLFGADTSGLDKGTDQAKQDVEGFEKVIQDLQKTLGGLKDMLSSGFDTSAIRKASKEVEDIGTAGQKGAGGLGILRAGLGGLATGIAAAFSIGAVKTWITTNADAAEQMDNLAQRMGMTVDEAGRWTAVAGAAGISTESLSTASDGLARSLAQARSGTRSQSEAFQALGIDINQTVTTSQLMLQVSDKFASMADGPEKTAIAMKLLGRSGAEIVPLLNQGSEALTGLMDAATESGAALSQDFVDAGKMVDDSLDTMNANVGGLSNSLFTQLAPAIADTAEGVSSWVADMTNAIQEGGSLNGVVKALDVTMRAINVVIGAVGAAIATVFGAAVIAVIPAVALLRATVISLKRAFEGDFSGAASAWSEEVNNAVRAIEAQVKKAAAANANYARFANDQINGGERPARGGGGVDPAQAQQGADILARIRAQEEAAAARAGEAAARRQRAAANAAAAAAKRLAEQRTQAVVAGLSAEQEANRNNYQVVMDLENRKLEELKRTYGEDSSQYQNELRTKERMLRQHTELLAGIERERHESARRIAEAAAQTDASIAQESLNMERQRIQQMRQLDQISAQEEIAMLAAVNQQAFALEQQAENKIYSLKLQSLRESAAADNVRLEDRERILRQIEELEATHAQKTRQIQAQASNATVTAQRQAAAQTVSTWQNMLQPVGAAFNGMFQGLYNRTMGFKQAFLQALDQILFSFVNMGIQMAVNWAANQLAMTGAATAGAATRTAVEATAQTSTKAMSAGGALMQILNYGYTAAAGAFSAMAGIPIVGPILAVAAGAAALGAVLGFAGSIVSSRGGLGEVENDGQMAILHKKETVLPASIAVPMRQMLADYQPRNMSGGMLAQASNANGGGSNYRGGDTNLTYSPSNQVGGQSLDQQLRRDSIGLRRWMRNEVRNGRMK